jgi:plastocyanin
VLCAGLIGACSGSATDDAARSTAPAQTAPPVDPSTAGNVTGQLPDPKPGAIVTLTPQNGGSAPPTATPIMDQIQLSFVPDTLIAHAGAPVSFHSSDSELHNINVKNADKRQSEFNRSIPPGGSFEHVFKDAGFYDVRCDIHPAMSAEIFVSAAPYAEVVNGDGTFSFQNLPPGAYTLTVYNGASTTEQQVTVKSGANQVQIGG